MRFVTYYVPRAIFYMDLKTPIKSFLEILLHKHWKTNQKDVQKFENELAVKFNFIEPLLTSHARIALYHILKYLNFASGSEIISSPISLAEMLKMIRLNDLQVSFVGYKKNSFNLDLEAVKITAKSKAFLYTPIAGIHTDMDALSFFCKKNNLILIQDLTQSLGGQWKEKDLHSYSDYNFYSLCDLKTLHTHRGGLIVSHDVNFRKYFKQSLATWFLTPSTSYFIYFISEDFCSVVLLNRLFFNFFGIWILKILNQIDSHLIENLTAGYGFRNKYLQFFNKFFVNTNDWTSNTIPSEQKYLYTHLQARIGLERLKKFDYIESERKKKIKLLYKNLRLKKKLIQPQILDDPGHVFWRAALIVEDFLDFQSYMLSKKIDVARSNLPWLPELKQIIQDIPGQEMKKNCVYIPIHYYLSDEEVIQIAENINQYEA